MAIFGNLILEDIVQVDDMTRLDARKSFVSKDEAAITLVEIEPESGAGYIDVTGSSSQDYYLDWAYSGLSRTADVSVRITTDGGPVTYSKSLSVLSVADDDLFSDDTDLLSIEPAIMNWVAQGRNSFLNIHRASQTKIVEWFNERGVVDVNGDKLEKAAFIDKDEVRLWSIKLTLSKIFESIHNVGEDVFKEKANTYASEAEGHKNRSYTRVDLDGDGDVEIGEAVGMSLTSIGITR